MTPVILCGGSGSRLWPLSRTQYPKQYLRLLDEELSLFQQTIRRIESAQSLEHLICLTNEEHRFIVAHQLAELGIKAHIILEPSSRNTAAAIAVVCGFVMEHEEIDNTLLILPSDHYIGDVPAFHRAVGQAEKSAETGCIVTFGVKPTHPETGYGYIQCVSNDTMSNTGNNEALSIEKFVEKPDLETAKSYLQQGNFFWNGGVFMFDSEVMIAEMERYIPTLLKQTQASVSNGMEDLDFFRLSEEFNQADNISIDYAVMERTDKGSLVPLDAMWSDVGSFKAMIDFFPSDDNDNILLGETVALEAKNNFVYSDNRLVSLLGVDDMVVVDTRDAVLVTTKQHTQDIGKVMKYLQKINNDKATFQPQIYRPWGWYETLIESETFKVKRIHVYSQAKLSLQKHRYRSEHWIVVSGVATVTCDSDVFQLHTNQSTFIPLGSVHRLENEQKGDLQIIEVQNGTYLGEDDIVRIEDVYHRA